MKPIPIPRKPDGELPHIEKGIPIPGKFGRSGRLLELFRSMEIGDSVFLPMSGQKAHGIYCRAGHRFTQRTQADGVRVWRVS